RQEIPHAALSLIAPRRTARRGYHRPRERRADLFAPSCDSTAAAHSPDNLAAARVPVPAAADGQEPRVSRAADAAGDLRALHGRRLPPQRTGDLSARVHRLSRVRADSRSGGYLSRRQIAASLLAAEPGSHRLDR